MTADSSTLVINWDPPSVAAQNGIITEYEVEISAQETGELYRYYSAGNLTSLIIEDLHPYYTYAYTVATATAIGRGPFSESDSIRMPEDGIIIALTRVIIIAIFNSPVIYIFLFLCSTHKFST